MLTRLNLDPQDVRDAHLPVCWFEQRERPNSAHLNVLAQLFGRHLPPSRRLLNLWPKCAHDLGDQARRHHCS
jgi:hypothetical protein